jgi:hypothetical protein
VCASTGRKAERRRARGIALPIDWLVAMYAPCKTTLPIPCYLLSRLCTQDLDLKTQHDSHCKKCLYLRRMDGKEVQVPSSLPFTSIRPSIEASHASHRKPRTANRKSYSSPLASHLTVTSHISYKVLQHLGSKFPAPFTNFHPTPKCI